MVDSIPITGLTDSWRVPCTLIEAAFGEGPSSAGMGVREALFVGPMLPTGTYTPNTVYEVQSEADVVAGAGAKSDLRRAVAMYLRANKNGKVNVLPFAETTGGSPAKAVTTATLSGTANASGQLICSCGRRSVTVAFDSGDAAADIMALMCSGLSAIEDLPFAVSGSSGACTATAAHYGIRGGTATYKPIRIRWNTPGAGLTLSGQGDLGTTTPGADGTTTEAAQLEAALAANANAVGKYYVVYDLAVAANLTAAKAWIGTEAEPLTGHRAVLISAFIGSKANAITLANGLNYERAAIGAGASVVEHPSEIAGWMAAIYQKREASDPCFNFDDYSGSDMLLTPAALSTEWWSESDINDLINGGLVPFRAKTGKVQHVFATTTRTLDATGTYADYHTYERHRVSGPDAYLDGLQADLNAARVGGSETGGAKIKDHPTLASGLPDPNAKIGRGVVTAFTLRGVVTNALDRFIASNTLQRESDTLDSLTIVRSTTNPGRILISHSIYTIDLLHQLAARAAESTAG